MKKDIAYAIVNKKHNLILFNAQLPIYWIKTVAKLKAEKCKGSVVEVVISEVTTKGEDK